MKFIDVTLEPNEEEDLIRRAFYAVIACGSLNQLQFTERKPYESLYRVPVQPVYKDQSLRKMIEAYQSGHEKLLPCLRSK